ncbi:MAG: 30S ribosomal protein S20 [Oscillospiraceae bacterium]|nr:30S ribosomal protein S20 [Oscillospiraceae bacterium]
MANCKSAKKRVKVIAVKTAINKAARSDLRTAIKKAELALAGDTGDKEQIVRLAMKKIDKAAARGLLHKNCASRKKSSLATKLNRAG